MTVDIRAVHAGGGVRGRRRLPRQRRSTRTAGTTVVRRNDQFLSVSGGALNIDAQKQDIHGSDQGLPNIVLQDLPATGPWTATARVTWNPTINYQNAGLMVYLNDGAFIKTGMVFSNGRKFEAFKEQNNSPVGPRRDREPRRRRSRRTWYIRLVSSDGQAVQAQYSPDNVDVDEHRQRDEHERAGRARRSACTRRRRPPRRRRPNVASFDWFKLTTPIVAERRVRRRRARHVPLEQHRAARPGRLHGRRRQAHAARRPRRLLRRRREQQPEHHPPAGAGGPVDDDDADDVQPERELRAGGPARVRGRRQLRQGRPRARRRPRGRVPARGGRRGAAASAGRSRCRATSRPRSSCASSPTGRC